VLNKRGEQRQAGEVFLENALRHQYQCIGGAEENDIEIAS
jgi:hypothetical protein